MKKITYQRILLLLLIVFAFSNCSKTESIPADVKINNFVWKGLNAYYLWQKDVANLSDVRFSSQNQLNNFLRGYDSPKDLFQSLLNQPGVVDRFSWIVDDYVALENSFQGLSLNNGMEFGLKGVTGSTTDIFGYVRYVIPNSDATTQGVLRGMIFNQVGGTQLTRSNYRSLLFSSSTNYTIHLADYNNGNPTSNGNTISLTKSQLQENPVAIAKVFDIDASNKVGYLLYNQFASSFDRQLNTAFSTFNGITDLIVDLRYNPGGSVRTASFLGSMITGQFDGQTFSKQVWNDKVMEATNDPSRFINTFTSHITGQNDLINSLQLTRIYFIVTGSSASASELVINSLKPYIDVKLVGNTTYGKHVGSVTLYDSDNYTRNGANLNPDHTWAMQPIVLEIKNVDNQNAPQGFTPEVALAEDYGNLGILGELTEPMLARTITYITTGARMSKTTDKTTFKEVSNSKLESITGNNMYVELQ